jgi:TRAP-type C4-dicarboxylate transport system permease small subunit
MCFNDWLCSSPRQSRERQAAAHWRKIVNPTRIVAVVLIIVGALALAYGGFSYTKDSTAVKLGPLELTVKEKETVNVPLWAGIGAIVIGGVLLVAGGKKG